jgi:hypothetical protein
MKRTEAGMRDVVEKFTIRVTDKGVLIMDQGQSSLQFTAGEALMLLDILRDEEPRLRRMAEAASPLPVTIRV